VCVCARARACVRARSLCVCACVRLRARARTRAAPGDLLSPLLELGDPSLRVEPSMRITRAPDAPPSRSSIELDLAVACAGKEY